MTSRASRRPRTPWPTIRTPSSAEPFERVQSGRRQSQQHGVLAKFGGHRDDAGGRGDQMRGGAADARTRTESPKHFAPGTNTCVPIVDPGVGAGVDNPADALVAGDERIAHSGKCGHPAREQQALGAGADAAPERLDHHVVGCRAHRAGAAPAPRASAVPKPLPANSSMPGLPRESLLIVNLKCHTVVVKYKVTHGALQRR